MLTLFPRIRANPLAPPPAESEAKEAVPAALASEAMAAEQSREVSLPEVTAKLEDAPLAAELAASDAGASAQTTSESAFVVDEALTPSELQLPTSAGSVPFLVVIGTVQDVAAQATIPDESSVSSELAGSNGILTGGHDLLSSAAVQGSEPASETPRAIGPDEESVPDLAIAAGTIFDEMEMLHEAARPASQAEDEETLEIVTESVTEAPTEQEHVPEQVSEGRASDGAIADERKTGPEPESEVCPELAIQTAIELTGEQLPHEAGEHASLEAARAEDVPATVTEEGAFAGSEEEGESAPLEEAQELPQESAPPSAEAPHQELSPEGISTEPTAGEEGTAEEPATAKLIASAAEMAPEAIIAAEQVIAEPLATAKAAAAEDAVAIEPAAHAKETSAPQATPASESAPAPVEAKRTKGSFFVLARVPEPEAMEDAGEVEAYASAAAQTHLDAIDDTFVAHAQLLLKGKERGRALDIGTGPGQIVMKLGCRLTRWKFVGVDRSSAMIEKARESLSGIAELAGRVEFRVANGNSLDFPDATFDLVICNSVLHHLAEPQNLFSEMARLAKPGGAILLRDLRRPSRLGFGFHVRKHGKHYAGEMRRLFVASVRAAYTEEELQAMVAASALQGVRVFRHGKTHIGFERALQNSGR